MRSGLTRLVTGELPATPGHRLDGTIPGALTIPVDHGIPEADMTPGGRVIRAVDMTLEARLIPAVRLIHGLEQAREIRCTFRNVLTTFTRTSKETSTVTLRKAGNNIRRTAGQKHPVGHHNLIATKRLDSKVIPKRNSAVRAHNAVVAEEEDPDVELVGEASSKSGVGESRNG